MRRMKSGGGEVRIGGSCLARVTSWSYLCHFPVGGSRLYCKSELDKSVLSGSPYLVPRRSGTVCFEHPYALMLVAGRRVL